MCKEFKNGPVDALAPDPLGVDYVPRLTTFVIEPCGANYQRGHLLVWHLRVSL